MPATTPVYSDLRPMQADQNDVSLGSVHIVQNAQNFHVHRFRLDALENGVGDAAHSGMDLVHRNRRLRGLGSQD